MTNEKGNYVRAEDLVHALFDAVNAGKAQLAEDLLLKLKVLRTENVISSFDVGLVVGTLRLSSEVRPDHPLNVALDAERKAWTEYHRHGKRGTEEADIPADE